MRSSTEAICDLPLGRNTIPHVLKTLAASDRLGSAVAQAISSTASTWDFALAGLDSLIFGLFLASFSPVWEALNALKRVRLRASHRLYGLYIRLAGKARANARGHPWGLAILVARGMGRLCSSFGADLNFYVRDRTF